MRIGIDIDDTITNTYEVLTRIYCKEFNVDEKTLEGKNGDYYEVYGITKETYKKFLKEHFCKEAFNIKVKENVSNIFNKLKENNEIYIVTARTDENFINTKEICEEYLNKNNIYFDKVIVNAKNKGKVCFENNIDILIDDNIDNCKSANEYNIKCLLFNSKINQNNDDLKRVYDWNEVYNIINNLKR